MARLCSNARSMHSRRVSERVVRLVVCAPAANVTQARAMPVRDVGRTVGADCNTRNRSSNPFRSGGCDWKWVRSCRLKPAFRPQWNAGFSRQPRSAHPHLITPAASKPKMPPRRGFWLGGMRLLQIGRSYGAAASLFRSASRRPARAIRPFPLPQGEGQGEGEGGLQLAGTWRVAWRGALFSFAQSSRLHRQFAGVLVCGAFLPPHPSPLPQGEGGSLAAFSPIRSTSTGRRAGRPCYPFPDTL